LTIDLVISVVPLDQRLRSVSFSLDHALLDLHDLLTCGPFKSTVVICFATPGFGDFNSQPSHSPRMILSEVHDLLTRVSHRLMTTNHFSYLGFGDFNSCALTFPRSAFNRSLQSVDACLLQIDGHKFFGSLPRVHRFPPRVLLKSTTLVCFGASTLSTKTRSMVLGTLLDQRSRFTSGLRRFHSLLSSKVFHTQSLDLTPCSTSNQRFSFTSDFGLREFQLLYTRFLPEHFTQSPRSNDACLPFDQRTSIHFGTSTLWASRFHFLLTRKTSQSNFTGVMDLPPPVPLDDGWSLVSSGLRRILTSMCTQRLNARALYPDPTVWNDPAPSWMDLSR
jgi:hypothetical protein